MSGKRAKALRREARTFRSAFNIDAPAHLQMTEGDAEGIVKKAFKNKKHETRKKKPGKMKQKPGKRAKIRELANEGWDQ